jgi:hypothetical protein
MRVGGKTVCPFALRKASHLRSFGGGVTLTWGGSGTIIPYSYNAVYGGAGAPCVRSVRINRC